MSLLIMHTVNDKVKRSVDSLLDFFQMERGGSLRTSMVSIILTTIHLDHLQRKYL